MEQVATLLFLAAYVGSPWWLPALVGPSRREAAVRLWRRARPERAAERSARPVEQVAADVRARGRRLHRLPDHATYVKRLALASAYDRVLGELCDCLDQAHLLEVLPPGPERDAERRRVELVLNAYGLPPADAA